MLQRETPMRSTVQSTPTNLPEGLISRSHGDPPSLTSPVQRYPFLFTNQFFLTLLDSFLILLPLFALPVVVLPYARFSPPPCFFPSFVA